MYGEYCDFSRVQPFKWCFPPQESVLRYLHYVFCRWIQKNLVYLCGSRFAFLSIPCVMLQSSRKFTIRFHNASMIFPLFFPFIWSKLFCWSKPLKTRIRLKVSRYFKRYRLWQSVVKSCLKMLGLLVVRKKLYRDALSLYNERKYKLSSSLHVQL